MSLLLLSGAFLASALPALERPFTLVYRVTIADLRPQVERDAALARFHEGLRADVDADRTSQARADRSEADYRALYDGPPVVATLTLSFDGRTLLDDYAPSAGPRVVSLLDGKATTILYPEDRRVPRAVRPDARFPLHALPFVGPSLPFLPVVREGRALDPATEGAATYSPAKVEGGDGQPLTRVDYGRGRTVVLFGHMAFQGCEIASRVVSTIASQDGRPTERTEYRLVSARSSSLPAARFSPVDPRKAL